MKTRKWGIVTISVAVLLLAAMVGLGALAAPGTAPSRQIPGQAMAPLPDAACTLAGSTRTCHLWAKTGALTMPDGRVVPVWGFSDSAGGAAGVPGPVIRANPGETLEVVFHNTIAGQTVALGFPGQEGLVPDLAGVPNGGTATYTFAVAAPGTFLYEAGLTSSGARQVAMGLYGPLVVAEAAPTWDAEVLLVFSEVDPDFNANPASFSMIEYKPQYWLINGRAFPDTGWVGVSAGQGLRMRYINAGVEDRSIGLLGLDQEVLAIDGKPLPFSYGVVAESLPAGQTMETAVQVPADAVIDAAYPLYHASLRQHNNNQRLADGRAAFGGMLAFLQVTDGSPPPPPPPPPGQGPVVSGVTAAPSRTNGSVDVLLTATADETTTGNNLVAVAQYRIDGGAWQAMSVSPAGATVASLSATIPAATVTGLTDGAHALEVQARDDQGNWGEIASTTLVVDQAGPLVGSLNLAPSLAGDAVDVLLTASADETTTGNGAIQAAQYRIDAGTWQAMSLDAPGASVTGLAATIPAATVGGLAEGQHPVEVQAQDDLGNWTAAPGVANLTVDFTGPLVSTVALDPGVIDLSQLAASVQVTAVVEDALSAVAAAEAFIDSVGAPGSGYAMQAVDGTFDQALENVIVDIPGAAFAALSPGDHLIHVVGQDAAGNWGLAGAATLTVQSGPPPDTTGPAITNLVASPASVRRGLSFTIGAVATDFELQSNIAGAEWFRGTDPGAGNGTAMTALDGAFDEPVEDIRATIATNFSWSIGTHQIYVRARDAQGNWGPVVSVTVTVTRR